MANDNKEETQAEQQDQSAASAAEARQNSPVDIPQNIKNLHSKALAALERNNADIAIDILFRCVEQAPAFSAARRNLRLAEIGRYKARGGAKALDNLFAPITAALAKLKIKALIKAGKKEQALVEAEKLLLQNPIHLSLVELFAETAIEAGYPEDGMMTMELAREHMSGSNLKVIEKLGRLYYKVKNYRKARECLAIVHRAHPNNAEIRHMLKDSEALATLDSGWTDAAESGNFRDVLANKEEAVKLEQQSKMVKTANDADAIINDARKKIEAEPNNVNYYISLANTFMQQKRYQEALETIDSARKVVGADPELDRRYSTAKIAKFEADIEAIKASSGDAAAADLEAERDQYIFDDIAERVTRYPNDQHLRYELALQYFKYDHLDDAIQQFQIAQKNPKDKVSSLYHLAICFRKKGLYDLAVSQLEEAIELIPSMTTEKMDIYYLLGEIALEEKRLDDAAKYFKEIYKVNVGYRDIAKHIENIYAAQKAARDSGAKEQA